MFFTVNFKVIKVDSPYNMLIGRPWLHTAGAITSNFYQRLKFPFKDLLIIIMAEKPLTIFKETSVPYIAANAFPEATFHSFKLVSMVSRASELESAWHSTTIMVAREMLKFGYQLGQGLCDAPGFKKKKKKVIMVRFLGPHVPHLLHHFPTAHFQSTLFSLGRLTHSLLSFLFSSFLSNTLLFTLILSHRYLHATISTIFSGKITASSLGTSKAYSSLLI